MAEQEAHSTRTQLHDRTRLWPLHKSSNREGQLRGRRLGVSPRRQHNHDPERIPAPGHPDRIRCGNPGYVGHEATHEVDQRVKQQGPHPPKPGDSGPKPPFPPFER